MNLLETVKQHENKTHKKFHDISMAALTIKRNIHQALLTAETPEEVERILKGILQDANFIEEIALSVNGGIYDK
jgi:hypothetical protein